MQTKINLPPVPFFRFYYCGSPPPPPPPPPVLFLGHFILSVFILSILFFFIQYLS